MNRLSCLFTACLCLAPLSTEAETGERLTLDGTVVTLNGDVAPETASSDPDALREVVRSHPSIKAIELSGEFLMTGTAISVGRVIEDFGLATEIHTECTDACIYMFVSGKPRSMAEGARIGLRRRIIDADFLRDGYEAAKARYGWEDEFAQAAMMYDRGQSDMRWALLHLVERGVLLDFALRIFAAPREDMWWPERGELVHSGVSDGE